MPKTKVVEIDESTSESEVSEVEEVEPPTLDEELERVAKNTKMQMQLKEQKKLALEEKRKRLAEPKQEKIRTGKPRFQKGSEEAKEWSRKMQEARRAKLAANKSEKKKLQELEEESKKILYETKEQEIKALKAQLAKFQKLQQKAEEEPEPEPLPVKTPRKRTPKTPVVSDTDDTDYAPEVVKAKKQVRRKRVEKEVAENYIESEQNRMRQEMLKNMQSSIFGL